MDRKHAQAPNAPLTAAEKAHLEGAIDFLSFLEGPVPSGLNEPPRSSVKPLAEAKNSLTVDKKAKEAPKKVYNKRPYHQR
ncbi:hypothetical protein Hte_004640 [Hypoxylon texense]